MTKVHQNQQYLACRTNEVLYVDARGARAWDVIKKL